MSNALPDAQGDGITKDGTFGERRASRSPSFLAGAGAYDALAGDGHDILIAGVYLERDNRTANQAIMAEWSRLDLGHTAQVSNLELGGGLNGAHVSNDDTVMDPMPVIGRPGDDLSGEVGRDWFLASAGDDLDRIANEALTGISE